MILRVTKAQDVRKPPTIIGPSPEASSLGQYGSWPVSLYTGQPNIETPLYTIDYRGFKLPIGLSYHASGIKVEDVASWVGTGWALQATGVVTRTVMGLEDESYIGFYHNTIKNKNLPSAFDVVGNNNDYKLFTETTRGLFDTEPDVFNFNIAGVAGQFIFDETGKVRTIPASTLKVIHHPMDSHPDAAENYWEILDDRGNTYILGKEGAVEMMNMMEDEQMFNKTSKTGWYLNKIILPNKLDSITFQYTDKYERYSTKSSQTYRVPSVFFYWDLSSEELMAGGYGLSRQTAESPYSALSTVSGKVQLRAINWKYGKIDFYANTTRKDITGLLLDSIHVADDKGNLVKNYRFHYDNNSKRPYLSSIVEKSVNSEDTISRFRFEYNGELPTRYSNAQDEWGYYNGATNAHLVPYDPAIYSFDLRWLNITFADRSCSETYMKSGTINKIIYPTGGYTTFDFEPNRYYKIGDGQHTQIPGYYTIASVNQSVAQYNPVAQSQDIDVTMRNPNEEGNLKVQITNYYRGPGLDESYLPRVTISAINTEGSLTPVYQINAFDDWQNAKTRTKYELDREDLYFDLKVTLKSGQYRITTEMVCLKPGGGNCPESFPYKTNVSTTFNYSAYIPPTQSTTPLTTYDLAGGLRIKEIVNYDVDKTIASRKLYDYTTTIDRNDTLITVPSGTLLAKPKFFGISMQNFICSMTGGRCRDDMVKVASFSSSSLATLGLTQGGYVGYEVVREREDINGMNGETIYKYSMAPNDYEYPHLDATYNGYSGWPVCMPNTDNGYKRGLLLEKKVLAREGINTKVVSQENYEYNFNDYVGAPNYSESRFVKIMRLADSLRSCCTFQQVDPELRRVFRSKEFVYSHYTIKSTWTQLVSKTILQDGVQTRIKYIYNNPDHMLPTTEIQSTSTGDSIVKSSRYPQDIVNENRDYKSIYKKMSNRNIITPLVEENISRNESVSKTRINYKNWAVNANLFLPDSILTAYGKNDPYFCSMVYNNYDAVGNILSYSVANSPTNFLWGYNNQYPVIKVTGSNYNKIAGIINLQTLQNPSDDQQIHDAGDAIRDNLTDEKILVKSYTYSPLNNMNSETNEQGLRTFYEYDGFGRLILIRNHYNNILKKYSYSYLQPITGREFPNRADSAIFLTSCSANGSGNEVLYKVPAGKYISAISFDDANAQAKKDIADSGQLYANDHGICTYWNMRDSIYLTRNNCTTGGRGSGKWYIVAARRYNSEISQNDANMKAVQKMTDSAQLYVNRLGICSYPNLEQNRIFYKECIETGVGSPVNYPVGPGRHISFISQVDANDMAWVEINTYGQDKANADGYCTYSNRDTAKTSIKECPGYYSGTGETYRIRYGKHTSIISQADATAKAVKDLTDSTQLYANKIGQCVCSGEGKKQISGDCTMGIKVCTAGKKVGSNNICTYHYEWRDGTRSSDYSETRSGSNPCPATPLRIAEQLAEAKE